MDSWLVTLIIAQLAFTCFIIWLFVHFRIHKSRQRSEERLRLLERFSTSQELSDFLGSGAGKDLLRVSGTRPSDPRRTLIVTVSIGVVTILLGGGFLVLWTMRALDDPEVFLVPGILGSVGGVGILLSAAISAAMARAWGLTDPPRNGDLDL